MVISGPILSRLVFGRALFLRVLYARVEVYHENGDPITMLNYYPMCFSSNVIVFGNGLRGTLSYPIITALHHDGRVPYAGLLLLTVGGNDSRVLAVVNGYVRVSGLRYFLPPGRYTPKVPIYTLTSFGRVYYRVRNVYVTDLYR